MQTNERVTDVERWIERLQVHRRTDDTIREGDRFYSARRDRFIWIVARRFIPRGLNVAHVVLRREGGSGDRRMLAEAVLLDRSRYRRDRRDPEGRDVNVHKRRISDRPFGRVRSTTFPDVRI